MLISDLYQSILTLTGAFPYLDVLSAVRSSQRLAGAGRWLQWTDHELTERLRGEVRRCHYDYKAIAVPRSLASKSNALGFPSICQSLAQYDANVGVACGRMSRL